MNKTKQKKTTTGHLTLLPFLILTLCRKDAKQFSPDICEAISKNQFDWHYISHKRAMPMENIDTNMITIIL